MEPRATGITWRYTTVLFVTLLAFYGALYALWSLGAHGVYFSVMDYVVSDPAAFPFVDMTGPLSWGECHRLGYDVYTVNPCDAFGRPINYSPLLLYAPFDTSETNLFALAQNVVFLITASLLLRPRSSRELAIATAACLSTTVAFALERANLDVTEFVLLAATALIAGRGLPGRIGTYAIFLFGGCALKFYPFAALLTVLRERPRAALALGGISALVIALFAVYFRRELLQTSHLPLLGDWGEGTVGAYKLPIGGIAYLGLPRWVGVPALASLVIGFGAHAVKVGKRLRTNISIDWSRPRFHLLLIGAITMVACVFAQTNYFYRGIFLLLLLPGLSRLRDTARASMKTTLAAATGAILFCLWAKLLWTLLDDLLSRINPAHADDVLGGSPAILYFVAWQLTWWWLISVMAGIVFAFILASPTVEEVAGIRRRRGHRLDGALADHREGPRSQVQNCQE
jgi:hypothetical protein